MPTSETDDEINGVASGVLASAFSLTVGGFTAGTSQHSCIAASANSVRSPASGMVIATPTDPEPFGVVILASDTTCKRRERPGLGGERCDRQVVCETHRTGLGREGPDAPTRTVVE